MTTYRLTIKDRVYEVQIEDVHASPIKLTVNGVPFEVTLEEEAPAAAAPRTPKLEPSAGREVSPALRPVGLTKAGERPVTAPMPGTIMDIQVVAGQSVERGQTLCILEAMKMKNSIRSPREGVIAQVVIGEGQSVGYGDTLFVFQ